MGKSTLVEDFVENHPEFLLDSEPYHSLQEQFRVHFAEERLLFQANISQGYLWAVFWSTNSSIAPSCLPARTVQQGKVI